MGRQVKRLSFIRMVLQTLVQRNNNNARELLQQRPPLPSRPKNDDRNGWRDYWVQRGYPWRTEPEIDAKRQQYLAERRAIVPDIKKGVYAFKDVKLSRADVEWLLATHENGRGPIDWNDEQQGTDKGLDLRVADLREVDLSMLPLARINRGTPLGDALDTHRETMIIHLEEANLSDAHLEGVNLSEAHLEGANLSGTFFDSTTRLNQVKLGSEENGYAFLADVHWNGVNLGVVNWTNFTQVGEEYQAEQDLTLDGQKKRAG